MTVLIETRNVRKAYSDFVALNGVTLAVSEGEFISIVGPNGAGKTTLVNVLTGLLSPSEGEVLFRGENIAGIGPVELSRRGMSRAFQLVHIFPDLTVRETIAVAVISQLRKGRSFFRWALADSAVRERVAEIAKIFDFQRKLDVQSRSLSQGEKKLLDVASAFALRPDLILLDEPTSGVSTGDKHHIMETLIAATKLAGVKGVIQVEHDMDLVERYSDRVVALFNGKVLADKIPKDFFSDAELTAMIVGKRR